MISSSSKVQHVLAGINVLLSVALMGMCQIVSAQGVDPVTADKIEEIIVYGDKSLGRLRSDLYRAEEKAFSLFNSLNSDDDYDIHCYKEAEILHKEMEALVLENTDLLKAVIEISNAKQILESERQKRCGDRIFVCRK